jgi:hypothetical protein
MYVIVRRLDKGVVLRNNSPSIIHETLDSAHVEAMRLALNNVGSIFDVFELKPIASAAANAPRVEWIPISADLDVLHYSPKPRKSTQTQESTKKKTKKFNQLAY